MLDWLKDHWEFLVGALIGLPGVFALWYQRRPNTLDYRILLNTPLLTRHNSILNVPLTINYLNNPMEKPHLLRVRVINTGKHAVRADDYASPITIAVEGADVYDISMPDMSPPGVVDLLNDADRSVAPPIPHPLNVFVIRPKLLNPGDWFEVQDLCEGKPTKVTVSSRYTNLSRPMAVVNERRQMMFTRTVVPLQVLLVVLGVVLLLAGADSFPTFVVFFAAAYALLFVWPVYARLFSRRKKPQEN